MNAVDRSEIMTSMRMGSNCRRNVYRACKVQTIIGHDNQTEGTELLP